MSLRGGRNYQRPTEVLEVLEMLEVLEVSVLSVVTVVTDGDGGIDYRPT